MRIDVAGEQDQAKDRQSMLPEPNVGIDFVLIKALDWKIMMITADEAIARKDTMYQFDLDANGTVKMFIQLSLSLAIAVCCKAIIRIPLLRDERSKVLHSRHKRSPWGLGPIESRNRVTASRYYGQISIGTPPQNFSMSFDSGVSDIWLPCSGCSPSNPNCTAYTYFECKKSKSCSIRNEEFKRTFQRGSITGNVTTDTICFGSGYEKYCTNKLQKFACIFDQPDEFTTLPFSGVIGLASTAPLPNQKQARIPPLLQQLFVGSKCHQRIIAFWLNGDRQSKIAGEIQLCGINNTMLAGSIMWVPIEKERPSFWKFTVTTLSVNDVTVVNMSTAFVDTGSPYITGPQSEIEHLVSLLNGTLQNGSYQVDCATRHLLPRILIDLGGYPLIVLETNYVIEQKSPIARCVLGLGIETVSDTTQPYWVLGEAFIGQFYTAFDYGSKQIGFAVVNNSTLARHMGNVNQ